MQNICKLHRKLQKMWKDLEILIFICNLGLFSYSLPPSSSSPSSPDRCIDAIKTVSDDAPLSVLLCLQNHHHSNIPASRYISNITNKIRYVHLMEIMFSPFYNQKVHQSYTLCADETGSKSHKRNFFIHNTVFKEDPERTGLSERLCHFECQFGVIW